MNSTATSNPDKYSQDSPLRKRRIKKLRHGFSDFGLIKKTAHGSVEPSSGTIPMNDGNTALAALMIGTAPSILVRQPELSPTRSMHAEVQKALSCAQLPTLDGSWRKKLSAFGIFSTFFRS